MSMKDRMRQRFTERVARERAEQEARRPSRRRGAGRPRVASREEQHARYLDCGPLAWDDRGLSPDF